MSRNESPSLRAYARFIAEPRLAGFDGLRCIAIVGVIWHHSLPLPVEGWLGRGHAGVSLFFALSGFLITSLLQRELRQTGDIALGAFWMRRSLRIFPLYYAVLAGFVLWLAFAPDSLAARHFWASLPYYASYTSNWLVDYRVPHPVWFAFAWSLATEEQFYVAWPLLLRRVSRAGTWSVVGVLGAVILVSQLARERLASSWPAEAGLMETILASASTPMLLGAALAVLASDGRSFGVLWRVLGHRASVPSCFFACAALIAAPPPSPLWLDAAFAALVTACALSPPTLSLRALASRPVAELGRVSYGMYLLHVPVLGLCRRLAPGLSGHPALSFALVLPATWLLAALSERYFERHFSKLRAKYRPAFALSTNDSAAKVAVQP